MERERERERERDRCTHTHLLPVIMEANTAQQPHVKVGEGDSQASARC